VLGVAHNPESFSLVGRIDGASWNNKRPRGVAFTFQVSEHLVETQGDVTINIFENAPSGSFLCNNFVQVRPDVAVIETSLL
jgi:hypothetical protein|tara:strand:- start:29 stop:271 length:243 start_codon:yes stop_codon:yes gene_type:complete